jgi:ABC-2 type transport system ATP-binding protein
VLLSSHILAEVEALCDRVTIIRAGRAVQSGTLSELRQLSRTSVSAQTDRPPDGLSSLPGVHDVNLDGGRVSFTVEAAQLGVAMGLLVDHGLRAVTSQPPTLEELFLREYRDVVPAGGQ